MAEESEKLRVDEVEVADDGPEEGEIVGESDDTASYLSKEIKAKHPLENSWTFWFDNPKAKSTQAAWGIFLLDVYTFSTVEDFWGVYNNINRPSELVAGADFYCFKHKIEPKWEDPVCANGGKWTMSFSKGKSDTSWLYTLLAMIGHQFDHADEICGAVVSVRGGKGEKIALWTKNAANRIAQVYSLSARIYSGRHSLIPPFLLTSSFEVSIGKQWKEFLDYSDSIGFIFHEEAKRLDRGAKNRYTV